MEERDEQMEPQDGDYTLTPCGWLGSKIGVAEIGGKFLGEFADEDDAIYFIRDRMMKEKFWPNIWNVSSVAWEVEAIRERLSTEVPRLDRVAPHLSRAVAETVNAYRGFPDYEAIELWARLAADLAGMLRLSK